jgi:hypothetical protein
MMGRQGFFFSEEKKQRTFGPCWYHDVAYRPARKPMQRRNKSFLVLFFKKEHSSS